MRYLTAGESHGPALTAIIEGIPAGLALSEDLINLQLRRRQKGYGRGGRMKIEQDQVQLLSGVRAGRTLGSPVTFMVENKDWSNWETFMSPAPGADLTTRRVTSPRPGHADLTGVIKYRHTDIRNVLERASARETTMRVAVGSAALEMLHTLGVSVRSRVISIGEVSDCSAPVLDESYWDRVESSSVSCGDLEAEGQMIAAIDEAKNQGESLGGVFEIIIEGLPPGLGSYVQWDRKLDARLAQAILSIQAIKGIEFGAGFETAKLPGSKVHDEIGYTADKGYYRFTNRAGGIEGGMTNGEPLILRAAMKPIPTLYTPLSSVDMLTKEVVKASVERSDTCAVPAAAVVGENVVAWELAQAFMEKFPSDHLQDLQEAVNSYREYARRR
jgi:chorismate synthase